MLLEILFILLTILSIAGLYSISGNRKIVPLLFILWLFTIGGISYFGFLRNTETLPPRFLLIILPSVFLTIYAYRQLKNQVISIPKLLAIHLIRIPVEMMLFFCFQKGLIPQAMTFEGWNWDILSALSVIFVLIWVVRKKRDIQLIKYWNIFAFVLLLNIVIIALLSAPSPIQLLSLDHPNKMVLEFPYVGLPGIIVPIVLLSHLLLFKATSHSNLRQ